MSLLNDLANLIHHGQHPTGQGSTPAPQQQALPMAQNKMAGVPVPNLAPGVVNDPMFLGTPSYQPQGGQFNPGFTPMQNIHPPQLQQNPQFQGYNAGQGIQGAGHFNPQLRDNGYFYN